MPTPGAPDFAYTVVQVTHVGAGAPDFQRVVVGPGGASVGGYASLTGPGETATPGDLDQEGGFTVNDSGTGINLNSPVGGGGITLDEHSGAGINLNAPISSSAISIQTGGPLLLVGGLRGGVEINCSSSSGVNVQTDATGKLGFFAHAPVVQQPTPVTLADVIALLQAYGLSA